MKLRPYNPADLDTVMTLWRTASETAHPFLADELDSDARFIRDTCIPSADITIAEQGGRVLGFIALIDSFVGALFVDPAAHRRGIGRLLIAHARSARPHLTLEVYLENHPARAFYAALGFREVLCQITDDMGRPYRLVRMTTAPDSASALAGPGLPSPAALHLQAA